MHGNLIAILSGEALSGGITPFGQEFRTARSNSPLRSARAPRSLNDYAIVPDLSVMYVTEIERN
jgi:hypothetical protein